ncbi:MAG TPA: hypothetical protein PKI61_00865 [bacterium]|nr:hypothetical protein [bacterium]HPT29433.1 hypothetical protein [bacterium]
MKKLWFFSLLVLLLSAGCSDYFHLPRADKEVKAIVKDNLAAQFSVPELEMMADGLIVDRAENYLQVDFGVVPKVYIQSLHRYYACQNQTIIPINYSAGYPRETIDETPDYFLKWSYLIWFVLIFICATLLHRKFKKGMLGERNHVFLLISFLAWSVFLAVLLAATILNSLFFSVALHFVIFSSAPFLLGLLHAAGLHRMKILIDYSEPAEALCPGDFLVEDRAAKKLVSAYGMITPAGRRREVKLRLRFVDLADAELGMVVSGPGYRFADLRETLIFLNETGFNRCFLGFKKISLKYYREKDLYLINNLDTLGAAVVLVKK